MVRSEEGPRGDTAAGRPIALRTAEPGDASAMAHLMGAAFASDPHTIVQDLGRTRGSLAEEMKAPITSWLTRPRSTVVAAQDPDSGELLGWICWSRNYAVPGDPAPQPAEMVEEPPSEELESMAPRAESLADLRRITHEDLEQWQRLVMPAESRCRFIVAIAVAPHAQSRGVGAALIAWGTERADVDGVFCWVHSSDGGRPAFIRAGFVEMGHLTVDLDAFAPHAPSPSGDLTRWGSYTFHHLRRPALGEQENGASPT